MPVWLNSGTMAAVSPVFRLKLRFAGPQWFTVLEPWSNACQRNTQSPFCWQDLACRKLCPPLSDLILPRAFMVLVEALAGVFRSFREKPFPALQNLVVLSKNLPFTDTFIWRFNREELFHSSYAGGWNFNQISYRVHSLRERGPPTL